MRTPTKGKDVINCLKPFLQKENMPDCFGKEFDATVSACNICHDKEHCGTLFTDFVRKQAKEVESKVEEIIQDVDFDNINPQELENELLTSIENGEEITVQMLIQKISDLALTVDTDLIKQWLINFIKTSQIKTQNGRVIKR